MKKVKEEKQTGKLKLDQYQDLLNQAESIDSRVLLIQTLIPLGLEAVNDMLQKEVCRLAGQPYSREGVLKRWGTNPGSVFLGDQKISVKVPRVRDTELNREIELESYKKLQSSSVVDDMMLNRLINGVSGRKYEKAANCVPETFGIKKSSVSRKFIQASSKKLKEFQERDLSGYDIVSIFMDGKTFAENEIIIALGVTVTGSKIVLGFVESHTENAKVCRDFLNRLNDRGVSSEREILFVIDGSKGLRKGIKKVFGDKGIIQRCQWHKRENIVSYLPKFQQDRFRQKLRKAYHSKTCSEAKRKLTLIRKELESINQSAVNSLDEGLEETLTLHKLGLFVELGRSFKTTNCIESVNRQLGIYTDRVTYWKNSSQRQRWAATALLEIEPNLKRVMGYKHLPKLRQAMKSFTQAESASEAA